MSLVTYLKVDALVSKNTGEQRRVVYLPLDKQKGSAMTVNTPKEFIYSELDAWFGTSLPCRSRNEEIIKHFYNHGIRADYAQYFYEKWRNTLEGRRR